MAGARTAFTRTEKVAVEEASAVTAPAKTPHIRALRKARSNPLSRKLWMK